jgi:hypothetical protein
MKPVGFPMEFITLEYFFSRPGVYVWEDEYQIFSFLFSLFRGERESQPRAPLKGLEGKIRKWLPLTTGVNAWAREKTRC